MKTVIMESKAFAGNLTFTFHGNVLVRFENNADLKTTHLNQLNKNFPTTLEKMEEFMRAVQSETTFTYTEEELTFDMFWKAYGNKLNKVVAEKAWKKLSQEDKIKAYCYVPKYKKDKGNSYLLYASTYLNSGDWRL